MLTRMVLLVINILQEAAALLLIHPMKQKVFILIKEFLETGGKSQQMLRKVIHLKLSRVNILHKSLKI